MTFAIRVDFAYGFSAIDSSLALIVPFAIVLPIDVALGINVDMTDIGYRNR
jgi:hypothetical protein